MHGVTSITYHLPSPDYILATQELASVWANSSALTLSMWSSNVDHATTMENVRVRHKRLIKGHDCHGRFDLSISKVVWDRNLMLRTTLYRLSTGLYKSIITVQSPFQIINLVISTTLPVSKTWQTQDSLTLEINVFFIYGGSTRYRIISMVVCSAFVIIEIILNSNR